MPTTIAKTSVEVFKGIVISELNKYPHWYQECQRQEIIKMVSDYGMEDWANELKIEYK